MTFIRYSVFTNLKRINEFCTFETEELLIQYLHTKYPNPTKGLERLWIYQQLDPFQGLECWRKILKINVETDGTWRIKPLSEQEGHRFVQYDLNGKTIHIDLPCLNLVLRFNQMGYPTQFNCQGEPFLKSPYHIVFQKDVPLDDLEQLRETYQLNGRFIWWGVGSRRIGWAYTVGSFAEAEEDAQKLRQQP